MKETLLPYDKTLTENNIITVFNSFKNKRVGDIKNSQNDPTLINQLFPSVQPINFSTGLEKTINWLKGENIDSNPLNLDLE